MNAWLARLLEETINFSDLTRFDGAVEIRNSTRKNLFCAKGQSMLVEILVGCQVVSLVFHPSVLSVASLSVLFVSLFVK